MYVVVNSSPTSPSFETTAVSDSQIRNIELSQTFYYTFIPGVTHHNIIIPRFWVLRGLEALRSALVRLRTIHHDSKRRY